MHAARRGHDMRTDIADRGRHVLLQTLAIVPAQLDVHLVVLHLHPPPVHLDHAIGVLPGQASQRGTVGTMHRYATPPCDEPPHRVARQRLAAAGQSGEQIADALDGQRTPITLRHTRSHRCGGLRDLRLDRLLQRAGHLPQRDFAQRHRDEQFLDALQLERGGKLRQIHVVQRKTAQLFFQRQLARHDIRVVRRAPEPRTHLLLRARGVEITMMRGQPVAAGL